MPTLPSELRNKLERVVVEARDVAEAGACAALEALAVGHHEPYPHMTPAGRLLRNKLRARARQLGDRQDAAGRLTIDHLVIECAYEHWHQMLFARFLAENHLLIEPQANIAISLEEAEELAKEEDLDVWLFAARCAQRMLPQIFRPDDPLLRVSFAAEHLLKLERLLGSLPQAVFTASDALGWVYQFWQSKKKDEVNRSEVKIGADEISAVTQLFTEPYMVEFLLHNTLGAWWAGKKLVEHPQWADEAQSEPELRRKVALAGVTWDYLRFVRGADGQGGPWRPAAGTFDGWPKAATQIKVLDPCCGSGHFLVAALHHLVPIRMAEEGLSAAAAVDTVLRDNIHGLEIDERCCQIAAFALAFEAWKMTGYRELPSLHIACTGIGPQADEEQWLKMLDESKIPIKPGAREPIRDGLRNLHSLFSQAPTLGSLIDPSELPADLIAADYETIQPYLTAILAAEQADDEIHERAVAAAGMVKAAELLADEYTLVITNVPYLGRKKQDAVLRSHLEKHYESAKADLASTFVLRCIDSCSKYGTAATVAPQNLLFLTTFRRFRETQLQCREWNFVARLGEHAFESSAAAGAFASMFILSTTRPAEDHVMAGIDVSAPRGQRAIHADEKATLLRGDLPCSIVLFSQAEQLKNPDAVITFTEASDLALLEEFADSYQGSGLAEITQFRLNFWELNAVSGEWVLHVSSPTGLADFTGMHYATRWADGKGEMALSPFARIQGKKAWGNEGIVCAWLGSLPAGRYLGTLFDNSAAAIIPRKTAHLPAIWCYCSSAEFLAEVRIINQKVQVANATLVKVPFDLPHWQNVAAEKYPNGLPEPESNDPTQWLFHGRPEESTSPLQVAVARLLGYRWPAELDENMRLSTKARELVKRCGELAKFMDDDGIVCIPSIRGEEPAAGRLLALLAACGIHGGKVRELAGGSDLDDWLRNGFFEQHCQLFHQRPFIWHIWDGRKRDGFHALVNYHRLAEGGGKGRKLLESLTYACLGDWIARQRAGVKQGAEGADDRLAAAVELQKRLEAILEGEPPFDIFVRWKPLHEQAIGWAPDINDGVRMNIRPFLAGDLPGGKKGAGILRAKPNIKWTKDRGKEPNRPKADYPWFWAWDETTQDFAGGKTFDGNRWNDCHYTNAKKQAARDAAKKDG
jgi:hypothetical protein